MRLCFNHLTHSSISTLSLHDALPISQSQDGLVSRRTHMSCGQSARRPMRVLVAGVLVALGACSSILDVKNPNDVSESALDKPVAAQSLANGILASTVRMLSGTTTPYSVA